MRNVVKTVMASALAAVLVGSVVMAGGQAGGDGQGRRGPGQGGPGFGGPGGPGGRGGFGVVMRELTDEQRTQVRAIMEEQREQGPPADIKLRHQLEAELLADTPNEAKIEELRQQIVTQTGDALTRHIGVQRKIAQILTPEQRAKARERLAQAPEGRRGGPRGR